MRRFLVPIAAVLLTAACGSSDPGTTTAKEPAGTPTTSSHSAVAPVRSASPTVKPKASPSPKKECPTVGDVIVWMKVKGVPDSAQMLGGNGYPNCQSTFEMVRKTSPNVPGACTEAAWASDNPGYDADATPAKRPKHVQVAVGPAC